MTFTDVKAARQKYLRHFLIYSVITIIITILVAFLLTFLFNHVITSVSIEVFITVTVFPAVCFFAISTILIPGTISFILSSIMITTAFIPLFVPINLYYLIFSLTVTIFCLATIISVRVTRTVAANYCRAYKEYFVKQNLAKIFTDLSYWPDVVSSEEIAFIMGVNHTGDHFSSNDFITAKYKKISFIQADTTIQLEDDEGIPMITVFKGRVMVFEFPQKFNFRLKIVGRRFHANRVARRLFSISHKLSRFSTESGEFNRNFKVFGDDGVESYRLLDPTFMIKIDDIAKRYKYKILLAFADNKMTVILNNGVDSFEPPIVFKPINEVTELNKVYTDIKVITDFVNDLSLAPIFI